MYRLLVSQNAAKFLIYLTKSKQRVRQNFSPRPRLFIVGAAALVFLGGLAFGFRTSLFERFCPLAITRSFRLRSAPGRDDTSDQAPAQPKIAS